MQRLLCPHHHMHDMLMNNHVIVVRSYDFSINMSLIDPAWWTLTSDDVPAMFDEVFTRHVLVHILELTINKRNDSWMWSRTCRCQLMEAWMSDATAKQREFSSPTPSGETRIVALHFTTDGTQMWVLDRLSANWKWTNEQMQTYGLANVWFVLLNSIMNEPPPATTRTCHDGGLWPTKSWFSQILAFNLKMMLLEGGTSSRLCSCRQLF